MSKKVSGVWFGAHETTRRPDHQSLLHVVPHRSKFPPSEAVRLIPDGFVLMTCIPILIRHLDETHSTF